jgi:hypothetical protein
MHRFLWKKIHFDWPNETNFHTWFINQQNKDFAYKYHQTVLQMLHDVDPPRTHWQLKSPQHTLWFDTLLNFYPQASIIMSHRYLNEVITSWYSLWVSAFAPFFNRDDITIKDPIGTVRRIYDHFDYLQWSDEFEEAMHKWLIDNPQGKQERHSYSLTEFNLETQMNKQLYRDYEKMFLST